MRRFVTVSFVVLGLCVGAGSPASAGTLSAQGNVTALDDVNQIQIVVGTADFGNELLALIELNQYAADGIGQITKTRTSTASTRASVAAVPAAPTATATLRSACSAWSCSRVCADARRKLDAHRKAGRPSRR